MTSNQSYLEQLRRENAGWMGGDYESLLKDRASLDQAAVPMAGRHHDWNDYWDKLMQPDRHWAEQYRDISWLSPEQLEAGQKYYQDEAERLHGIYKSYQDDWWNAVSGSQEFADWSRKYYDDMLERNISRFNEAPHRLIESPYEEERYPNQHESWIRSYLTPGQRMIRPHGEDFDITPEMIERWRAGEDIFANMSGPDASQFIVTPNLDQRQFQTEYQDIRDTLPKYEVFDPDNKRVRRVDPSHEYNSLKLGEDPRNPFSIGQADEFISDMINRYRTTGRTGILPGAYEEHYYPELGELMDNLRNDPRFSYQWEASQRAKEDWLAASERQQLKDIRDRSDAFYASGLHENFDKWNALLEGGPNRPINTLLHDDARYYFDAQAPFGHSWRTHDPDYVSSGKSIKDIIAMGLGRGAVLEGLAGMRDAWGRPMFIDGEFQNHPDLPGTEDMRQPGGIFYVDPRHRVDRWYNTPTEWLDPEEVDMMDPEAVNDLANRADEVAAATTADEHAAKRQEHAQLIWNMIAANGTVEAQEGDANDINGDGWISPQDAIILANPEEVEDKVWEWGKGMQHPGYRKMQDEFQRRYEEQGWSGYEDPNYDPSQGHTMDIRSVYNPVTKQTWSGPSSAMPVEIRDSLGEDGGWVEGSLQDHILEGWSDPLYEHAQTGGKINQIIGSLEKRLSENPDYYNTDWWREELASAEPGSWIADYDANKDGAINQADLDMYRSQLEELGAPEGYRLPHSSVWSDAVGPPETAYGAFWQDPGNPEGIQAQDLGAFAVDSTTGVPFVFARNVDAGPNRHRPYANPEASLRWLLGAGDSTSDWHKAVVEGFVDPSTLTREEYDYANDWWNERIEENPSYAEGYGYLPSFESLADFQLGETQSDPVDYIRQVAFNWDGISDGQDWAPHEDWANDPNRAWYTHHPLTGEPLENYEQKYYSGYYGYGHKTGDGWVTGQGLPEHLNVLDVGADLPGQNRRLHTDASVTEDLIRNYSPEDDGIFDSSGNLNTSSTSTGTVDEDEGLFDSEGNLNTSSNVSGNQSTHSELEQVIDLNKDDPDFIWDRDTDEDGIISPVDRLHDINAAHRNDGGDTGGGSDTGGDGGGDVVDPGDGNEENRFGMKDEDIVAGSGRQDTADLFHPYGSKEYNEKQGKSAFHKAFGLHRNTPMQNFITE